MRKPEFAERNCYQIWDLLDDVERDCLRVRFKVNPKGRLPELESEDEIDLIMRRNEDVRR